VLLPRSLLWSVRRANGCGRFGARGASLRGQSDKSNRPGTRCALPNEVRSSIAQAWSAVFYRSCWRTREDGGEGRILEHQIPIRPRPGALVVRTSTKCLCRSKCLCKSMTVEAQRRTMVPVLVLRSRLHLTRTAPSARSAVGCAVGRRPSVAGGGRSRCAEVGKIPTRADSRYRCGK
jgi:hypothetical protein